MIRAKNMMTKEVVTINLNSSIKEASRLATLKTVSSLIVSEKDKPVAVISERDIIKAMLAKKTKVKDAMSKNFIEISPNTKFYDVSRLLREKKIRIFPVVESGELIGLITETDIVEATRDFTRMHQITQDIILTVFGLATAFFLFYFSPIRSLFFG